MPMGVLTDDEFDSELNNYCIHHKPSAIVVDTKIGRGNINAVPESLRKVIAEEAINGAPAAELEKIFDVSQSSISAYKQGATSTATYHLPDKDLQKHTNNIKDIITGKARGKLIKALDCITDDKMKDAKLETIASVAKNLSGIVKDFEPEEVKEESNKPQFIVFAPQMRDEKSFDVIKVRE